MSLTTVLNSHGEIRRLVPNMKSSMTDWQGRLVTANDWKTPLQIPTIGQSFEAGMIGTAVDYVMRALLTQKVGREHSVRRPYVAESGLHRFPEALARTMNFEGAQLDVDSSESGWQVVQQHLTEIMDYLAQRLETATQAMETFIDGKRSLESIAKDALFMARLDLVYRVTSIHVADYYFEEVEGRTYFRLPTAQSNADLEQNITACANLFASQIQSMRMTTVQCNPAFGRYSEAVGGADADFIIDQTLVDAKSTNKLAYRTDMMAQILAYAAMAKALDIPVERVGLYFARFGVWMILSLSELPRGLLDEYLAEILSVV